MTKTVEHTIDLMERLQTSLKEDARAKWMAERRGLLTSTDAARILGCSPYGGPIDVYVEKTGKVEPEADNPNNAQRAGRYLERPILIMYADLTGIPIEFGKPHESVRAKANPLIAAQIDARRTDEPTRPSIDAKNIRFQSQDWGQEGTDQIPLHIAIQMVIQMYVLDTPWADVAALFSGQDIVPYRVHRDAEVEGNVVGAMLDFRERHIVADVPPPIDASDSFGRYLAKKFRAMIEGSTIEATKEHAQWADRWLEIKGQKKLLKVEEDELKNRFREAIGAKHSIVHPDWKATWSKPSKDSVKTDWEAVSRDLASLLSMLAELLKDPKRLQRYVVPNADKQGYPCEALALDVAGRYKQAIKQFSKEYPGIRKLTLTAKKGDNDDD